MPASSVVRNVFSANGRPQYGLVNFGHAPLQPKRCYFCKVFT